MTDFKKAKGLKLQEMQEQRKFCDASMVTKGVARPMYWTPGKAPGNPGLLADSCAWIFAAKVSLHGSVFLLQFLDLFVLGGGISLH